MGWGGEMGGSGQAESLFCAVGEQGEGRAFWSWSCHWASQVYWVGEGAQLCKGRGRRCRGSEGQEP